MSKYILILIFVLLAGCAPVSAPARPGAIPREETVVLPTRMPTIKPSPVSTRVMPLTSLTPGPTPTITPIPDEVRGLVVNVIDGNTVEVVLEGDPTTRTYPVRYLGIKVPPNNVSDPWGVVAFETNRRLVNGKVVRLERDQSETDEEDHLLRDVYVGDQLVSILLTEQGLASTAETGPDNRYQAQIQEAEQRAKSSRLGLWGPPPTPTPHIAVSKPLTATQTVTATLTVEPAATKMITAASEPEVTTEVTASPSPTPKTTTTTTPTRTATVKAETTTEATQEELQGPK